MLHSGISHLRNCIFRKLDTNNFEKASFFKKIVRSERTSLSATQFHASTNYKKLTPCTKTEKSRCKRIEIHFQKVFS